METKAPEVNSLYLELHEKCESLFQYALKEGRSLDHAKLTILDGRPGTFGGTSEELLAVYNYLVQVVSPTSPRIIFAMERSEKASLFIRILGPLPIVRQFTLLALLSMLAFIWTSLSKDINVHTIQLSILQGYGWPQVQRLIFLISCASVGASFYGLFKINSFLKKGTFDLSLAHTYWSRYVLGIVAGLLLSELFVSLVETSSTGANHDGLLNSAGFLLKPILAILGGFSADLVYTILSRLVETVESLFKGDTGDLIAQKEQEFQLRQNEQVTKVKNTTARKLLQMKQDLVQQNVPQQVLDQLDSTMDEVTSGMTSEAGVK